LFISLTYEYLLERLSELMKTTAPEAGAFDVLVVVVVVEAGVLLVAGLFWLHAVMLAATNRPSDNFVITRDFFI
jgi:hypothetical protein